MTRALPERATSLRERLFRPVDIAWLAFFRIAFGILMFADASRYLVRDTVRTLYIEPRFHFKYFGFEWVEPWPGPGMYIHFGALCVVALLVALGLFYRIAAALFFLGFTYVFLLDQARYLNHAYLICLLGLLMVFLPAHRAVSLDARRRAAIRSQTVPAWTLWLLRAQLGLVYFFAGLAKLNGDWLRGEPIRMWLAGRSDYPVIGPLLEMEATVYIVSYGGLVLDLTAFPLLLWSRTRPFMFAVVLAFHLANAVLFSIGIFPWLMIAATPVFFPPDWPRRLAPGRGRARRAAAIEAAGGTASRSGPIWVLALLGAYMLLQVVVPLRHFLYPGAASWTEEGHRFSWRMKLRGKAGWSRFIVKDSGTGETWVVDPADYLTGRQVRKMSCVPDMVLQFAHWLAEEKRAAGYRDVEVRARVYTSLNGRRYQLLVDPEVNLAAQRRSLAPARWILPLEHPLGVRRDDLKPGTRGRRIRAKSR